MRKITVLLLCLVLLISVGLVSAQEGGTLDQVKARGNLVCGVNQELLGFGLLDPESGEFVGFDVDFCRAIAAAIFGDATAVEFSPLNASQRLAALSAGEVDVLIRNTTWTLTRDTDNGLDFAPTTFYDGQTLMVRADSGLESWEDLDGVTICTTSGTTTELNMTDQMEARGLTYDLLAFESTADTHAGFVEGRCDIETSDRSQLVALRASTDNPAEFTVWIELFSKEPLGPVVRHGDNQWGDVVNWTVYALIQAEEFGIDSMNIDSFLRIDGESDEDYSARVSPAIARFLDADLGIGSKLGLANDFVVEVIRQVGNYAEVYEEHLGANGLGILPRATNALWTDGGLIYAPAWK
jgi:general L-amino acid transport system substrate-binding protein